MTLLQRRVLEAFAYLGEVHLDDVPPLTLRALIGHGLIERVRASSDWYRITTAGRLEAEKQSAKGGVT